MARLGPRRGRLTALIEHAYKQGINTWDTADVYSHGKSEEIVGKALKKYNIPRNRVVILTKCFFGVDDEGNFPPIAACATNDGPLSTAPACRASTSSTPSTPASNVWARTSMCCSCTV
ncbi:unnamed protein product [Penicillium nalgiovense]|nr:unnamed protein product [Penicillium nalgiovense]